MSTLVGAGNNVAAPGPGAIGAAAFELPVPSIGDDALAEPAGRHWPWQILLWEPARFASNVGDQLSSNVNVLADVALSGLCLLLSAVLLLRHRHRSNQRGQLKILLIDVSGVIPVNTGNEKGDDQHDVERRVKPSRNEPFRVRSSLCEPDSTRLSNIFCPPYSGAKWIRVKIY